MKTQKLIVIAAIVCLLVGASGAAMAEDEVCGLVDGIVNGNVTASGDCIIRGAIINGNVIAELDPGESLVVKGAIVTGKIKVTGGSSWITTTILPAGAGAPNNRIVIESPDQSSYVGDNGIDEGDIVVRGSATETEIAKVYINSNTVLNGDIKCVAGSETDTLATRNIVIQGKVTCPGFRLQN